MTEIKKTLAIIKARWPEVTLIVGLYTLVALSNSLFRATKHDLTKISTLLCTPFLLSLMVVSFILNYGFLRTVYLEGQKRQTPIALLKKGKHFFWRMTGFSFIWVVSYFILARLFFLITKYFTSIETGFFETAKAAPWLYQLCSVASMLILIKLVLFVPALLFVLDCRIVESFKFLKKLKLLDSKELVALFCFQMVLPFLRIFLQIPYNSETSSQYIFTTVFSIITSFISLIIAVMAVRFVASHDLVYDNHTALNSESLQEY